MTKIALVNHGCAKNLVDAELMLGILAEKGYEITLDENSAEVVIVNTCSFIHDAEKESVDSILELVNNNKKVVVTGCLPQKHKEELKDAIPEVVAMLGTTDFTQIADIVDNLIKNNFEYVSDVSEFPKYCYPENVERQQITVGSSSYIKIADGCNYNCGYCIIPKLRGKCHSRKIEDIVKEAKKLADKGVTEIVLIAQDTTSYGVDLYGKPSLPKLLDELNKIENILWIRIMYAYPTNVSDELLEKINSLEKVVKYLDLPLQHSNLDVLKSMCRPDFDYRKLIQKIRNKVPNIAIRTAFIVGYPGETEEQFEDLYNFVKDMKFEKMGVFEYSKEKGTISYSMKNHVPAKTKKSRYNRLMELQQQISAENNKKYIGKTLPCIIEGFTDEGLVMARSEYDAPEIDGMVYITTDKQVVPGDIENVKIKSSSEYDLYGEL
ncbi:30S ribosomal protein S12 methylthiotransferase RimO [bacterium]|nr:30S ribosomal protein S12 methylthiotransferase RimO [bacterium]